jgi:hypothetical protein
MIYKLSFRLHNMSVNIDLYIDLDDSKVWLRFCRILCSLLILWNNTYRVIYKISTKDLCYQQSSHMDKRINNFHSGDNLKLCMQCNQTQCKKYS